MADSFSFEEKFEDSKKYCSLVMDYLKRQGLAIEDKADNQDYQRRGIDFIAAGKTIEFKADDLLHKTNNIAFEVVGNIGRGVVGSCLVSQADWLLIYDTFQKHCHLFDLKQLREMLTSGRTKKWQCGIGKTQGRDGKVLYASICLLIPLAYAKERVKYAFADLSQFQTN